MDVESFHVHIIPKQWFDFKDKKQSGQDSGQGTHSIQAWIFTLEGRFAWSFAYIMIIRNWLSWDNLGLRG